MLEKNAIHPKEGKSYFLLRNLNFFLIVISFFSCQATFSKILEQEPVQKFQQELHTKKDNSFTLQTVKFIDINGIIGERLNSNLERWELDAYDANPAMVEMFFDRDRSTPSNSLSQQSKLNPWSGEFVGKYLCASIRSYEILQDPRQKALIEEVVNRLLQSQGKDGYMGPFDQEHRLTGPNTWDFWGHYWAIRALLMYSEVFESTEALEGARKAADLIVNKFMDNDIHWTNDGLKGAVNYAIIDAFAQLYMVTGEPSYLKMAQWIEKEWESSGVGLNYISKTLAGKKMHEFGHPGNRWESLHGFLGIHKMYLITGEQKYYDTFTKLWQGIQTSDIHNTGGFSTGEVASGDPYAPGVIETCCTVAWIDMSAEMLKLTGNSSVADEIELATYNGLLGGQHPSGRWWTYNTPMDGVKEASAHSIVFQARPGSPELNCCSVNGPRGLSLLSQWALLKSNDGIILNFYGSSQFEVQTPREQTLSISQMTEYPSSGNVLISLDLDKPEPFSLQLRIPSWSLNTVVKVNGEPVKAIRAGSYLNLSRIWKNNDKIEIELDMTPHYWSGAGDAAGKASIYSGPILLAFDPVYNKMTWEEIPEFSAKDLSLTPVKQEEEMPVQPWVLYSLKAQDGREVRLVDFATAGAYGNKYVTWLPITDLERKPSNTEHPIWTNRNVKLE